MKLFLSFFILLSCAQAFAKEIRPIKIGLSILMESFSIETKETSSTNQAEASFFAGQVIPSIGIFIHPKILLGAQYAQSFSGEFTVSGVGGQGRYYFLGGSPKVIELEDLEVSLESNYSMYAALGYKSLSIGSGDFDVRFNVIEASLGIEKTLADKYFLQLAGSLSQLSSSNNRSGTSFGGQLGIGYHY
jgi:hypothetical protein